MFINKKLLLTLIIIFSTFANFSHGETLKFGGSTYDGQTKKGKAHGEGIFTFTDGSKYEGKFKKNKMHGKGKYTDVNGRISEGKWRYGKFKKKLDNKTREIVKLDFNTGPSSYFEIRGKGDLSSKWFEAEKNSSGTYTLTSKGEMDMKKAKAALNKGDQGDAGTGGGGACGG